MGLSILPVPVTVHSSPRVRISRAALNHELMPWAFGTAQDLLSTFKTRCRSGKTSKQRGSASPESTCQRQPCPDCQIWHIEGTLHTLAGLHSYLRPQMGDSNIQNHKAEHGCHNNDWSAHPRAKAAVPGLYDSVCTRARPQRLGVGAIRITRQMPLQTSPFLSKYLFPIKIVEGGRTLALIKLIFLCVNLRIYRFPFLYIKILQGNIATKKMDLQLT